MLRLDLQFEDICARTIDKFADRCSPKMPWLRGEVDVRCEIDS